MILEYPWSTQIDDDGSGYTTTQITDAEMRSQTVRQSAMVEDPPSLRDATRTTIASPRT
ncbi:hypothetical protein [Cylindrospermum stagnale]|uniref:hypothetical protein n=1 Tax=Cylindrospermum stagnale TaxID=142864 RepID=UPI000311CA43|nr:hypothetical protein [Cylindrospermum stagnale]